MRKLRDAALIGGFVLLVLVATAVVGPRLRAAPEGGFHGTSFQEVGPAPAFTLTDQTGRPTSLDDYRGRPVLLFFGFTHCPDVCPLTLQRLTRVRDSLGRRGRDIAILLVTVDPARDTPEVMAEYVARFGHGVTGLTGSASHVEAARTGYGVYAVRAQGAGTGHDGMDHGGAGHGGIAHSDAVYGIDRAGRLRVLMAPDAPEAHVRADLATLVRR
jgi:protein SCO1